jgi:hypothetical protein
MHRLTTAAQLQAKFSRGAAEHAEGLERVPTSLRLCVSARTRFLAA